MKMKNIKWWCYRDEKCVFTNCLAMSLLVLDPVIPEGTTLEDLGRIRSEFTEATRTFTVQSSTTPSINYTVVEFPHKQQGQSLSLSLSLFLSQLFILFVVFYASPLCWRSVIIYSVCIFSSLPKKSDTVHWKAKFLHGPGIFCKLVCYPHRLIVDVIINHWYK